MLPHKDRKEPLRLTLRRAAPCRSCPAFASPTLVSEPYAYSHETPPCVYDPSSCLAGPATLHLSSADARESLVAASVPVQSAPGGRSPALPPRPRVSGDRPSFQLKQCEAPFSITFAGGLCPPLSGPASTWWSRMARTRGSTRSIRTPTGTPTGSQESRPFWCSFRELYRFWVLIVVARFSRPFPRQ